jgi:hypothetical protein
MAKDAKGHGSEKRGGGDYAPSASGKPGYNPMVGGKRMFGRQPTPAEKAVNSANVKAFSAFAGAKNPYDGGPLVPGYTSHGAMRLQAAMRANSNPPIVEIPAHSAGVAAVGQPPAAPNFRLNSYTHEIVSPTGDVSARMRLGKNNGLAVDKGDGIHRSGGPSIHDAVAMPDYMASQKGGNSFPADHIAGALHFLTGTDYSGHTVRRIKG